MQGRQLNISNQARYIFCAVRVSFLHSSRKRYGPTDRRTDGPTDGRTDRRTCPLIEMRGRIQLTIGKLDNNSDIPLV